MYRFAIFGRPTHLYSRIEEVQLQKHQSVMSNTAPAPYQYRILGELILEGLLKEGAQLGMEALTMIIIPKMSLHFLIFLLSYLFFRQFQLGIGLSLFGVACTFYAILASYYNEDLVFYQYLEFIFFLAAFILILKKIDFWLIPLTFLAMLNKETSALIPFVYLINRLEFPKQGLWKSSKKFLVLILGNLFFGAMAEVRTFFCLLPLLLAASLINFDRWTREAGHATRNKLKA